MRTRIKNAQILTMDSFGTVYNNGEVIIDNDRIVYVGSGDETCQWDTELDAGGKLLMPGFKNCHTHVPMSLLRGWKDDVTLEDWLFNHIFPVEDILTDEQAYWGTLLSCVEMIKSGTTMFADSYMFPGSVAEATIESGMRALLSRSICDPDEEGGIRRLKEAEAMYRDFNNAGKGRIHIAYAPHAVYTCSPAYLRTVAETAKAAAEPVYIELHMSETATEVKNCLAATGKTPAELAEATGLMELPMLAAHCVHLTERDMDILAKHGVWAVHNPVSNMKLGSGIMPLNLLRSHGVNVCLGTDGPASNNTQDMLRELGTAALIHKGFTGNPATADAKSMLRMAVSDGAIAAGFPECSSIEPGKKADLIMLDLSGADCTPCDSPEAAVVYSADRSDVTDVMVDGEWLMQNRSVLTLNEEDIKGRVVAIRKHLREQMNR